MIRFLLNQIKVKYGTYTQEGNKIRRTFSNGFSYVTTVCKSSKEAERIVNQLNQVVNCNV
jgi:phage-related protein